MWGVGDERPGERETRASSFAQGEQCTRRGSCCRRARLSASQSSADPETVVRSSRRTSSAGHKALLRASASPLLYPPSPQRKLPFLSNDTHVRLEAPDPLRASRRYHPSAAFLPRPPKKPTSFPIVSADASSLDADAFPPLVFPLVFNDDTHVHTYACTERSPKTGSQPRPDGSRRDKDCRAHEALVAPRRSSPLDILELHPRLGVYRDDRTGSNRPDLKEQLELAQHPRSVYLLSAHP